MIGYALVSVLLFPVTLAGYAIWVCGALFGSRESGASGTAQGPLSARFIADRLGTRHDAPARKLMLALPNVPALGLQLFVWPIDIAHKLSGYVPRAFRYPFEGEVVPQYQASARMTFFDAVVERYLPSFTQFVILGAGFDTRAFRLRDDLPIRSFEVDAPQTQFVKRAALDRAGISSPAVVFVAADFRRDRWFARLVDAGYDPRTPALFLWEGVTPYLDRAAVEDTLRSLAAAAAGTVVAFDYLTTEPLQSTDVYFRLARAGTRLAGEPLTFGFDSTPPSRDRVAEFVSACGLTLEDQQTFGESGGARAWGGFAVAVVNGATARE